MVPLKRTPEGEYIIPRDLACQLLSITQPTLGKWLQQSGPPPICPGGLPATQLGHWIRKKQTLKAGQRGVLTYMPDGVSLDSEIVGGGTIKKDLTTEKIRKESAQADKLEMENAVTAGDLVWAQDVAKGWADILSRVKTRMMRVPFSAAQVVVGDDDLVSIQTKIKDFVIDALNELSVDWQDTGDEDDDTT